MAVTRTLTASSDLERDTVETMMIEWALGPTETVTRLAAAGPGGTTAGDVPRMCRSRLGRFVI
jgi:hypothetical protein